MKFVRSSIHLCPPYSIYTIAFSWFLSEECWISLGRQKRERTDFFSSTQGVQTQVSLLEIEYSKLGGKAKDMNFQHSSDIIYWATKNISGSSWRRGVMWGFLMAHDVATASASV